ncbi:hypothetical protein HWV62_21650 [Athelia sp. TMB]|nr:hypothetical protein HWV62_21650 [Athelia sp. TMB]
MYDSDCSDNNNNNFYPSNSLRDEFIAHIQSAAAQRASQNDASTQFDNLATATAEELATICIIQAINDATNGGGYPPPSPGAITAEALANINENDYPSDILSHIHASTRVPPNYNKLGWKAEEEQARKNKTKIVIVEIKNLSPTKSQKKDPKRKRTQLDDSAPSMNLYTAEFHLVE